MRFCILRLSIWNVRETAVLEITVLELAALETVISETMDQVRTEKTYTDWQRISWSIPIFYELTAGMRVRYT